MNRRAWQFFHEQGGGIVGKQAVIAWELAGAEALGEALGWSVAWDAETFPDLSWCDRCEDLRRHRKQAPPHEHELYTAVLRDARGKVLDSLGGIDFGPYAGPSNPYRRVVEAELMLSAIMG